MREQPSYIVGGFIGPTEVIVEAILGPQQHDAHTKGWRWNLYLQDAKLRAAAVREGARLIIAARNARMEALQNEIIQIAAE